MIGTLVVAAALGCAPATQQQAALDAALPEPPPDARTAIDTRARPASIDAVVAGSIDAAPAPRVDAAPAPRIDAAPAPRVDAAPAAPCAPPSRGAVCSRTYRNLFRELGKSDAAIAAKVDQTYQQLFAGTEDERVFHAVDDMGYIYSPNSDDVRSEGMSYGMMIAVQLDRRDVFDRLWRWSAKYMRHESGARAGYFAWRCRRDGTVMDPNPASDGEAYFATALFFAAGRWGNGTGLLDYRANAQAILDAMIHKEDGGTKEGVTNMFNRENKLVVFTPYHGAARYTDPSYHLPAFYEIWARAADKDREFWRDAAAASRAFLRKAAHPTTGLSPDYATFEGQPTGSKPTFHYDAWRVAANIGFDHAWFEADPWQVTQSDRILTFFRTIGLREYKNHYTVSGEPLSSGRSPGLVAMNAVAALALPPEKGRDFVNELWVHRPGTGTGRYYDSMLFMLAVLHASGNFRVYLP